MFNGGCEIMQQTQNKLEGTSRIRQNAYIRIVEQPAPKALRFRYECEGRSAGSIPGSSSTPENKKYPAIQVVGYQGRAVVVVSCVTKDEPYRPHPHNLVGREGCKRGVCTMEIPPDSMTIQFSNLGIQCVKKKDIESALRVREEIRVDPYRTGFNHRNQPTSIDLNSVRLCFQVFLEGDKRGKFTVPLQPIVSEPIFDKKAMSELVIVKLSECSRYADGDRRDIILLCEKIAKEDIQVRFFEEKEGGVVWEDFGDFQPSQVHKQVAISFIAPRYRNPEITDPVKVLLQLRRPSDGATSEPREFQYLPVGDRKRKRPKFDNMLTMSQEMGISNDPAFLNIKVEPKDGAGYLWQGGIMEMNTNQFKTPNMPSTSTALPSLQDWNFPYVSHVDPPSTQPVPINNDGLSFIDMDANSELTQLNLISGELGPYDVTDVANLSANLTASLSLTEIQERPREDQNMTDSLTRLANNTMDIICQGGTTYK